MLCFFDFSETTIVTVIRKVIMMIAVTGGGRNRNKVSSWGSGGEFIGRFIVNINLGATQAETKAVIFHSSSLFMDPPSTASKNTNSYSCSHTCWEGMVLFSHGGTNSCWSSHYLMQCCEGHTTWAPEGGAKDEVRAQRAPRLLCFSKLNLVMWNSAILLF